MTVREDMGEVKISNEVISHIVRRTAREVDGVVGISGRFSLNDVFGKKDTEKGISIKTENNSCDITIEVKLEYGLPIYDVARKLQKRVKDAVEQMTGLIVGNVNVVITGLAESGDVEPRERLSQEDPRAQLQDEETL
ncbi:MAG: Asp23/Gls24 family envelope stress response protein [Candidatus Sumerlaeia bacterium]